MNIVFNKIPKLAKLLYGVGFVVIIISMVMYFYYPNLIDAIKLQQAFIGGAIIVAIGSVINTLHQFKRPKRDKRTDHAKRL
ncbi:hypothetical protein FLL45_21675 [Aliikangiella marina]|uniref:Uncharacterized protein n=1 Tax=Aliikangiella marina TaxID=1712262 RepID=A0A545T171_9GAMM|nr:hypothetical protein [Aliikangiella marina]TQV70939.1 hypothetical protein FLL45_21675 [Aliikangiella marina]